MADPQRQGAERGVVPARRRSELFYPVLPIFLITVLDAPATAVGAIEGTADGVVLAYAGYNLAYAALSCLAGRLADRLPGIFLMIDTLELLAEAHHQPSRLRLTLTVTGVALIYLITTLLP